MASSCNCAIGKSPFKNEIEDFIRQDYAYSVINDWLIAKKHKTFNKPTISRHKTAHMGLEKSHMRDQRKFEVIPKEPGKSYTISEVRDMAMQEFAARLKAAPHLIGNAQLIPFLVESLRAENRRPPSDPLDAILALFTEVTASDETSAGNEASLGTSGGDSEGVPEEFGSPEEDRSDTGRSEEVYLGPPEGPA
ncbi:MAG TPA: hypothetical protein VFK94_06365 [Patescibacteria group bacterium]|nr:hypothetical protein [Patescibacteria group bacterium]